MHRPSLKTVFWLAMVSQVAGAQMILWNGIPLYHRLVAGQRGDPQDLVMAAIAVLVMQPAYWVARSVQPRLRFGRHVFVGHVMRCAAETSFVFPSTLLAVVVLDEWEHLHIVPWKIALMGALVFAMYCIKMQWESLGDALIEGDRAPAEEKGGSPERAGAGDPEQG